MGTYRERRERRAARREEWAEGREAKAGREFAQVKQTADAIPLGQPILVGHHSEKRARRDQKKIRRGVRRGLDHQKMAKRHRSRAAGIRDQLDRSIYSDDHDAAERLRERIAEREAEARPHEGYQPGRGPRGPCSWLQAPDGAVGAQHDRRAAPTRCAPC